MADLILPLDENNEVVPLVPAKKSVARTTNASMGTSRQVTFNAATKMIEVTALAQALYLNWGTTAASSTVYDHVIPAGMTRQFFIPLDKTTTTSAIVRYTAVNLIEVSSGGAMYVSEF